jgi:hypothetical protein
MISKLAFLNFTFLLGKKDMRPNRIKKEIRLNKDKLGFHMNKLKEIEHMLYEKKLPYNEVVKLHITQHLDAIREINAVISKLSS